MIDGGQQIRSWIGTLFSEATVLWFRKKKGKLIMPIDRWKYGKKGAFGTEIPLWRLIMNDFLNLFIFSIQNESIKFSFSF